MVKESEGTALSISCKSESKNVATKLDRLRRAAHLTLNHAFLHVPRPATVSYTHLRAHETLMNL
eukprot:56985-Prymnesium_polylepis.1